MRIVITESVSMDSAVVMKIKLATDTTAEVRNQSVFPGLLLANKSTYYCYYHHCHCHCYCYYYYYYHYFYYYHCYYYYYHYYCYFHYYYIISTTGGMAAECKRYHSRLAELLAKKKGGGKLRDYHVLDQG